jgi:hypothetical protein
MLRYHFFDHTDPWGRGPAGRVRLFDQGHLLDFIGENIAAGYPSVAATCRGWMRSAGHRANILDPDYTVMGAGFAFGRSVWGSYCVTDFGVRETTPAEPPGESDSGSHDDPSSGQPPGTSTNVVVDLYNVDDQETLYVNGNVAAVVGYGEHASVDLGPLTDSDSITVAVENFGSGYTWGIRENSDGTTVLQDEAGTVGRVGANGGDETSTGIVHQITFGDTGTIYDTYTVQPG